MEFFQQVYRGLHEWWRYLIGIIIICAGYMFGQGPLLLAILYVQKQEGVGLDKINQFMETNDFSKVNISANFGFVLMLCLFIFAFLFMLLALNFHQKKLIDVTTSRARFDWSRFIWSAGVWFGLGVLVELIFYMVDPSNYYLTFKPASFVGLLIISILILPIQTSMEEWFFRGYLNQFIFKYSNNPLVPIIATTILFSLIHSMNPEIDKFGFWTMQLYYIGAGLFLSFLAYADKGLEIPMGVHFATNFYGACFVTYDGAVLQTNTLMRMKQTSAGMMCIAFYIVAALFLIIAMKKYKWSRT
jgi:uncharacterized protein